MSLNRDSFAMTNCYLAVPDIDQLFTQTESALMVQGPPSSSPLLESSCSNSLPSFDGLRASQMQLLTASLLEGPSEVADECTSTLAHVPDPSDPFTDFFGFLVCSFHRQRLSKGTPLTLGLLPSTQENYADATEPSSPLQLNSSLSAGPDDGPSGPGPLGVKVRLFLRFWFSGVILPSSTHSRNRVNSTRLDLIQ